MLVEIYSKTQKDPFGSFFFDWCLLKGILILLPNPLSHSFFKGFGYLLVPVDGGLLELFPEIFVDFIAYDSLVHT